MTASNDKNAQSAPATDYDSLPYLSLPISYTQPARLAAIAQLYGVSGCAPPERARVLELGCASGGNLLPLAARWPEARFVGIDLSAQMIADGQRQIKHFGLTNVDLQQADIADFATAPRSFDYVICHGVYSWVPPAVQDAALKIISETLTDAGVAVVSFNVAPGWHLRSPVREALRYHAGESGTPQERVARARAALDTLAKSAGETPYGALIRAEAKQLEKMPSSYILGEFLTEYNHAVQFSDFVRAAEAQGLEYVGDAYLDIEARGELTADGVRYVKELETRDRLRAAQELDYLSGRTFRRVLLRRRRDQPSPAAPSPAQLSGLHLTANLRRADNQTFLDARGRQIRPPSQAIYEALAQLSSAYPGSVAVNSLLENGGPDKRTLAQALLDLALNDRAVLWAAPLEVGRETDVHPKVWAFARAQAALGRPGACSLFHVDIVLSKMQRFIAAKMDGTMDKGELTAWLSAELSAGRAPLPPGQAPPPDARALAERCVADAVRTLSVSALLAPSRPQPRV